MQKWKGDLAFILIVGMLVGGWLSLYPRPDASLLSPLPPPADLDEARLPYYASPEGLKLTYRLYEPPGKVERVLVFLHDTLLHGGWYADMGRELARLGIAVYLPDRRGWGHSAGDRDQVARDNSALTGDIAALIVAARYRYPQAKVFLGGHGRGAGLVLRYVAERRPVAGVVLVAPYIADDQPNLRKEGWRRMLLAHPGEAFLARSGLIYWRVWECQWPPTMVAADPLIATRCSLADLRETVPADPRAAYAALTVPLLCVQGEADPLFVPERTADLLTRFATSDRRLDTLPGVDYLGVINAAAGPIANWMAGH